MPALPENNVVFLSFNEGLEEERTERLNKFFKDDVARWASYRSQNFGDYIVPKHVAINISGQIKDGEATPPHHTYYVEHGGIRISDDDIEEYHRHHVVCDCVLQRNLNDGQGGVNINACPELRRATSLRARRFGAEIRNGLVLEKDPFEAVIASSKIAMAALETVLLLDYSAPEIWPGTIMSGVLSLEQASEITGEPEEEVVWYAQTLEAEGKITFDGETLSLAA